LKPVWRRDGDDLLIPVRLTPGARREGVGGCWTDANGDTWLMANVRAVPEKGRANGALIALLADSLSVPKSTISLESGDTNRLKRLRITGGAKALSLDRITKCINQQAGAS
jgi:uncharacterized protein YggU (UPF0235/DUF167 family)